MRPSDVSRALSALVPARRPVYLWGPPGCAKSSVVRQTAGELKLELVDVRATLLDPVDLRGLPAGAPPRLFLPPPQRQRPPVLRESEPGRGQPLYPVEAARRPG